MANYFNTSIDYLVGYTDISHKIEPVSDTMLNIEELTLISNYRNLNHRQKHIINIIVNEYVNNHSTD